MAFEVLEAFDGGERGLDAAGQIIRVDEAEIVRRNGGKQRHPDVRRRRAVCDGQRGNDLHVVWRKRVIRRHDKRLEVVPGLARHRLEKRAVVRVELGAARGYGPAEGVRDKRCGDPQREHGRRRGQGVRTETDGQEGAANRDERTRDHVRDERRQQRRSAAMGAGCGRFPFEQPMLGDAEAHERYGDGVKRF